MCMDYCPNVVGRSQPQTMSVFQLLDLVTVTSHGNVSECVIKLRICIGDSVLDAMEKALNTITRVLHV